MVEQPPASNDDIPDWHPENIELIAQLNDQLRRSFLYDGMVYHSEAVKQLPDWDRYTLNYHIQEYDTFYPQQHQQAERCYGELSLNGERYCWRIDYFDRACWSVGVEKPADDPSCVISTYRVMVIDVLKALD